MKRSCWTFVMLFFIRVLGFNAYSQLSYGNEWIVPGQPYYKIQTYQNGLYAISGQDLIDQGLSIHSLNPVNLQLWHRGEEQAILLKGVGDGKFDPQDSLIFYGKRNDGALDARLYQPADAQLNPYINLHSDTCAFFLTAGQHPGKRVKKEAYRHVETQHTWHWREESLVLAEAYNRGELIGENRSSYFTTGEGWTGSPFAKGATGAAVDRIYFLPTSEVLLTGPDSRLEVMLSGYNKERHNVEIMIGTNTSTIGSLPVELFEGYENRKFSTLIPSNLITGESLKVTIRLKGFSGYPDRIAVSYLKLDYPQKLTSPTSGSLNFSTTSPGFFLVPESSVSIFNHTDHNEMIELERSSEGKVYVPAGKQRLLVHSASTYLKPSRISQALLKIHETASPQVKNADFLIITHPRFLAEANEYAAYRKSADGGAYNISLSLFEELCDEFAYGEFTPSAIRDYCRFMAEYSNVRYLFIIGRGLDVDYNHYRVGKPHRFHPSAYLTENTWDYVENFVPHAGNPTSDLAYVNGLKGNPEHIAAFPVGRLCVKYPGETRAYLNKVKTHERMPANQEWRKHVLHLSGGKTKDEIQNFRNQLQSLAPIIEDTVFGGKVTKHIVKTVNSYVEDRLIETVADEVNKGVSFITFLGHDSPNVKDIDIGYVTNQLYGYSNYGKYPMLILNGCNTTNASVPYSLSENWLHTENLGGLLSMGHTDYGYIALLENYTRVFYQQMFSRRSTFENQLSVGDVQRLVHLEMSANADFYINTMFQQVFLMGDPSIKMFAPEKPDFTIKNVVVSSFDSNPVSAVTDSFQVHIDVHNFGLTYSEPVLISIRRTIGTTTYTDTVSIKLPDYSGTIRLTLKNREGWEVHGVNVFTITLDPHGKVPDSDRQNNHYSFQYFIPASSVATLFPEKYAIVNKPVTRLVAQAADLFMDEKEYVFELDTSHAFNSPFKKTIHQKAPALARVESVDLLPDLAANDSMVYYWRVRFREVSDALDTSWTYSSFVYIKNGPQGWSQSSLAQIDDGETRGLEIDLASRSYMFSPLEVILTAASPGKGYVGPDHTQPSIYYTELGVNGDGIVYENRGGCGEGLLAITMSKSDLVPYFPIALNNVCGQSNSGKRINSFRNLNSADGQNDLIRYLDAVKPGDYILLASSGNVPYASWSPALKSKIEETLGARLLASLNPEAPYMILGRKGEQEPIFEQYGEKAGIINYSGTLKGRNHSGSVESTLIGPALEWKELNYQVEARANDHYRIDLIGVDMNGDKDTLRRNVASSPLDLSDIDATRYPYLQLKAYLYDSINLTSPLLRYWNIVYEGVPEGTMEPLKIGREHYKSKIKQEGDSVKWSYVYTNISEKHFNEPLKVVFVSRNMTSGIFKTDTLTLAPLAPGASLEFTYALHTTGWVGDNSLMTYVNPELQPETYYPNNVINVSFSVTADRTNPLLDVTFDGIRLMNGEIVSPSPLIVITVRDENQFKIMNDSTGVDLFLKRPCSGCNYEKITYADPAVISWGQASARSNTFKVEYNPKNLEDGVYTLRVQGRDASGNKSGLSPYEVSFEVVNESAITNFYPYPNPFSSSTRFVFTLTGDKIPDDILIKIMTVTGKVVRQISKAELGPIRIGNNISDYAWDGKDDFGDQLANGVYLYKVDIKNGDLFNHRKTSADKAFKKGYGKMYLIR